MEAVRRRSEDEVRGTAAPLAFNVGEINYMSHLQVLIFLTCLSAHKGRGEDKYNNVYVHFMKG